ncbi:MAG: hypothetical protein QOK71_11040, partial [Nitrososphaeraceae archaeon]|nr:hypothetical protein [Nitrososphaeraceae archaeon]
VLNYSKIPNIYKKIYFNKKRDFIKCTLIYMRVKKYEGKVITNFILKMLNQDFFLNKRGV